MLRQATAAPPYDVQAMVVLTDGVENTAPLIASVSSSVTANTFAIGLGLPSNISVAALDALTQGHDGYLVVTGKLTTDQRYYLTKYFLQVLAGVTNANVIVDPHCALPFGVEHRSGNEVLLGEDARDLGVGRFHRNRYGIRIHDLADRHRRIGGQEPGNRHDAEVIPLRVHDDERSEHEATGNAAPWWVEETRRARPRCSSRATPVM